MGDVKNLAIADELGRVKLGVEVRAHTKKTYNLNIARKDSITHTAT